VAVTLQDVARHAGVSVRTASNVVNDFVYVSEDTRAKVRRAVEELGYRPNLVAKALRQGRSKVIAIGVPELVAPYFSDLCGCVVEEAKRRSYTTIIEQTGGLPAEERQLLTRPGAAHLIDGLIFSPLGLGAEELLELGASTPLVLLGERVDDGPFDHVGIDNVAAARMMTSHLFQLGRRRVAAIGHRADPSGRTAQFRTEGYHQARKAAGAGFDEELVVPVARFSRADGAVAMDRLLDLPRPPDAVFCYGDLLALGALRRALKRGLRVPDDLAIAGFDDIEDGRFSTPSLTTIGPDKAELARLAVSQLLRRLDGDVGPPVSILVDFELHVRESTAGSAPGRRSSARQQSSRPVDEISG
jgi:LacI family repressor for deo operon, udp, cdd, tsx, nupC, and nupG